MSYRGIAAVAYLVGTTAMGAVLLSLLGGLLSRAAGHEQYRELCFDGALLGMALSLIALGIRSVASVMYWMKKKSETAHV